MRRERSWRGISIRAAVGYLENCGGEKQDETTVAGDGWTAQLSAEKVSVGPSLQLNEVTVVFEGEAETLDPLIERFAQKAMRAGG
ncbi:MULTISPECIES: hypothetical protein [Haloarcula]|uniref:hypothetical protein n=1 Tax=Haloarcula TaxID=2237 RepID=UPI0023ED85B1|nr:hypothetical protein [Halomicroarcula sp. XH51]